MHFVCTAKKFFLFISIPVLFTACCSLKSTSRGTAYPGINGEMTVHFIDVGRGDSTFITMPDGESLLIDAGGSAGGPRLVRYLKALGIKRINHSIFTHPHDDHLGGIFSVNADFRIDRFYDNGFSNFSSTMYGDYLKLVRSDLMKYHVLQAGEEINFNGVRVEVLNPLLPPAEDLNEDSVVLRIHYGDIIILLAGDLGITGERRLLNVNADLKSDVIKVGHHGENDACSEEFLKSVRPDAAIISVARVNKYARPDPGLINRLKRAGVEIYRTDLTGDIILSTDGKTYHIRSLKQ